MSRTWSFWSAVALVVVLAGCDFDTEDPPVRDENTVEQKHMGSIGNSLTAGFQGGGIQLKGQVASFPNLVSQRVTGRSMTMPLVAAPGIGSESGLSPLFVDEDGDITREPIPANPLELLLAATYPLPYDNLGVPGATTRQMLDKLSAADGVGGENPFFDLILRNSALPGGGTAVKQLERIRPDIITLWTGNNEVLGGATSGSPQSDDPTQPGYVVPPADFEVDFLEMVDRIEALEPEVVAVMNVPPVTAIPYTRFFGTGSIPGVNRWSMEEDLDGDDDPVQLVLLHAPIGDCPQCYLPSCGSPQMPCRTLPANATLTVSEVQLINEAVEAYNAIIEREVTARGWALVDINAAFQELPTRPGTSLNSAFPWQVDPLSGIGTQNTGSAFTLDGIHPSEKGAARVANEVLASLNATYGTDYAPYDETAIENVAGFERAPVNKRAGGRFTDEGLAGLRSVSEMLSARY